ncbi:arsenate reductase (glutaredoxin) [Elizabethkingia bruuniana]|uniref:Arsenate reductase (Glutaredoxin) n=2 Tax=Elizabethkingia TaxID=308865 RepID=A0A7T7UZ99_9FLAO|nr:arsenate reductase (glutaredoxin) [Elizabethkingia bruuniana]KGO09916.1 arsenate reductase [Elizabethkingia miricola]MCT3940468.1 arsenate reductase (glutaredoxin) [Elizabethkingia anophelis]MCT4193616.1 arsenate reductase (glutaredoxin) [Elizabethkingia anophelis]MDV3662821.1 arsenate reductase (glutaredoxin) [Elizabethkingia anophelis]QDZ62214.1 arsenate reductase (glutaredoxin) [Elizabethkingia bruuniana]
MKIYYNPQCSKSNCALELIKQNGIIPQVVDYLNNTPSKVELIKLLSMLNLRPFEIVRKNEVIFQDNYFEKTFTDEQWLDILLLHPELIERPIVVYKDKAIIARPIERLLELWQ